MKIKILFTILVVYFFTSCAYKPLYKRANLYYPHKVKIVIKSKEKYENNASIMKLLLDEKLNSKSSKDSNLKLIVSIERVVSSMGINKDLSSDALMLVIEANYVFFDKKEKYECEVSASCFSNFSKSIVFLSNRAGVPVFKRPILKFAL